MLCSGTVYGRALCVLGSSMQICRANAHLQLVAYAAFMHHILDHWHKGDCSTFAAALIPAFWSSRQSRQQSYSIEYQRLFFTSSCERTPSSTEMWPDGCDGYILVRLNATPASSACTHDENNSNFKRVQVG